MNAPASWPERALAPWSREGCGGVSAAAPQTRGHGDPPRSTVEPDGLGHHQRGPKPSRLGWRTDRRLSTPGFGAVLAGQSLAPVEGQGSALKPARGFAPWTPSKGLSPLQSINWGLFSGEGQVRPISVRVGPPLRTNPLTGSKGRCPWRGSKGQR